MFSVYSNFLDPLKEVGIVDLTDNPKLSEIYNQLRIAYNQGASGILDNVRMLCPKNEGEDCYTILHRNKETIAWLHWVNKNITLEIGKENYQTLGVRLRIATSMLNKLVYIGILTVPEAFDMHLNLIDNVERENRLVTTEELPFLG